MARKDHMFLVGLPDQKLGIMFCSFDGYDKMQAYEEVKKVLEEVKNYDSYNLNYLGVLDYVEMDPGIKDLLDYFEKHNPVWFLVCG